MMTMEAMEMTLRPTESWTDDSPCCYIFPAMYSGNEDMIPFSLRNSYKLDRMFEFFFQPDQSSLQALSFQSSSLLVS